MKQSRLMLHIAHAMAYAASGEFRTIAQIVAAITPEYPNPDNRPGSGAVLLFLAYRKPFTIDDTSVKFGHKVHGDQTTPKGAYRI